MAKPLWMPMYWAKYLGDTAHFSTFQHGAYLLLICAYWQNGGPIPADDNAVAQMCRTTKDKVAALLKPVTAKFTCKDGLLHHQTIDEQLIIACERISKRSASAHARWDAMHMTTTITKEKRRAPRNRPSVNGVDALALSPERVAELQDKTDRIMQRGKYAEKLI